MPCIAFPAALCVGKVLLVPNFENACAVMHGEQHRVNLSVLTFALWRCSTSTWASTRATLSVIYNRLFRTMSTSVLRSFYTSLPLHHPFVYYLSDWSSSFFVSDHPALPIVLAITPKVPKDNSAATLVATWFIFEVHVILAGVLTHTPPAIVHYGSIPTSSVIPSIVAANSVKILSTVSSSMQSVTSVPATSVSMIFLWLPFLLVNLFRQKWSTIKDLQPHSLQIPALSFRSLWTLFWTSVLHADLQSSPNIIKHLSLAKTQFYK